MINLSPCGIFIIFYWKKILISNRQIPFLSGGVKGGKYRISSLLTFFLLKQGYTLIPRLLPQGEGAFPKTVPAPRVLLKSL